jgi:hypothetical protein
MTFGRLGNEPPQVAKSLLTGALLTAILASVQSRIRAAFVFLIAAQTLVSLIAAFFLGRMKTQGADA